MAQKKSDTKKSDSKKQAEAKEALAANANDTPSVQGDTSTNLGSPDTLKELDNDPESNRSQAETGAEEAAEAQEDAPQVGSPDAPAPTEPVTTNVAEDADQGEDKPHPHLDNTDAEDQMSEVHEHGEVPEGMASGAEAAVPRVEQSLSKEDASALDLKGIREHLVRVRNKINKANEAGVRLTRNEFDEHLETVQIADEVHKLLGNMR
jgi:hypothetical protein